MRGQLLSLREIKRLPGGTKLIFVDSKGHELTGELDYTHTELIISTDNAIIIDDLLMEAEEDGDIEFYQWIEEPYIDPDFRKMLKLALVDLIKKGDLSLEVKSHDCYSHFEYSIDLSIDGEVLVSEYLPRS